MSASLISHCDPLFQAICRYNRIARKGSGASLDYTQVRTEVEEMFEVLARTARGDIALGEQYRRIELPLIIFVDSMMAGSALPFAQKWSNNPLAFSRNERSGDEKFFILLDETLAEKKEGTDERLAIYYICLGLGFTGGNQPEYLRKRRRSAPSGCGPMSTSTSRRSSPRPPTSTPTCRTCRCPWPPAWCRS